MTKKNTLEKIKDAKEKEKIEVVKTIKESSIKAYYTRLKSLMHKLDIDIDYTNNLSKYYEKIIDIVESYNNNNSKKNMYIMLSAIGELFGFEKSQMLYFNQRMKELNKTVEDFRDTHELTDKEKSAWITLTEYENVMKNLKNKIIKIKEIDTYSEVKKVLKYLLILWCRWFSGRNEEIALTKVYIKKDIPTDSVEELDKKYNYIILDENNETGEFLKNNYKTNKIYHSKLFNLENVVVKELIKYYPLLQSWGNNFFMFSKDGEHISANALTKWFYDIFDKTISTQMIRKIIKTETMGLTIDKIKKLEDSSNIYGHSLETAIRSYIKIPPKK